MKTTNDIRRKLDDLTEPFFKPEYRGQKQKKGRPDDILWINFNWLNANLFPILIEEEYRSGFDASIEDFRLFAKRGRDGDNDMRYHLTFPIFKDKLTKKAYDEKVKYNIIGLSGKRITSKNQVSENLVHKAIKKWVKSDRTEPRRELDIYIFSESVIRLHINMNLFDKTLSFHIPIFTEKATDQEIKEEIRNIKIPCLSVVSRRERDKKRTERYKTRIQLLSCDYRTLK